MRVVIKDSPYATHAVLDLSYKFEPGKINEIQVLKENGMWVCATTDGNAWGTWLEFRTKHEALAEMHNMLDEIETTGNFNL